jgi:hypothetical protein
LLIYIVCEGINMQLRSSEASTGGGGRGVWAPRKKAQKGSYRRMEGHQIHQSHVPYNLNGFRLRSKGYDIIAVPRARFTQTPLSAFMPSYEQYAKDEQAKRGPNVQSLYIFSQLIQATRYGMNKL